MLFNWNVMELFHSCLPWSVPLHLLFILGYIACFSNLLFAFIVDTLVFWCFVHPYYIIPSNIPFVIQRDVIVCEQSNRRHNSLQTYLKSVTVSCGAFRHSTLLFVILVLIRHQTSLTLHVSGFMLKCIRIFVVYLNIIERNSQLRVLLQSY